jgi:hypothetical protein
MDHFPFFLSYFPQTARVLSDELEDLLQDSERSALWAQALAYIRQTQDIDFLHEPVLGMSRETQFFALLLQLMQSIPEKSALWWCFGLEVYLRDALEGLLEAEALDRAVE